MQSIIKIIDLKYTYPDGRKALNGINLHIAKGEKVALVGANGAGKSTLLLHLNGVLQGEGRIEIDGLQIDKKNLSSIRAKVGLIFQDPDDQLFSPTVFDDVAFGLIYQGINKEEIPENVRKALDDVGMDGYEERNPYHLSGGEKKRIAIATVLVMNPSILVIDEPSTGLDPRSRRELIDLINGLPQTLLIASHDLDLISRTTQRMIVMNHGEIVADGSTDQLMKDTDLLLANGLL